MRFTRPLVTLLGCLALGPVVSGCVVLLVPLMVAQAATPKDNVNIELATDGTINSKFVEGDGGDPDYVALAVVLGTALQVCGFEELVHGTADSCEVRSKVSGTNAATCVLSIVDETGDDATNAGLSMESAGLGDEILFSSTSNTAKSGQLSIKCDDSISSSQSLPKAWGMTGTATVPDPVVADRDLSFEGDFSSGQINDIDTVQTRYGRIVSVDAFNPIVLEPDCTFTINSITNNDGTADFTWNAASPATCGPVGREGFQLALTGTGMNQVEGRMFRGMGLTGSGTASGSGQLWQDGTDTGRPVPTSYGTKTTCAVGCPELPDTRTSTVGYGTWAPGDSVVATTFKKASYQQGCCGPTHPGAVRVVSDGFVPPPNLNGTAAPVDALRGTHFLSTQMNFWQPYDVWNSTKGYVNHRWTLSMRDVPEARFIYNEQFALSWSVYLPTNYSHQDSGDGVATDLAFDRGAVEMMLLGEMGDADNGFFAQWLSGGPGGIDHFFAGVGTPPANHTQVGRISLGSVAPGIGHWTCFILVALPNTTTGWAKLYRHDRCELNNPADIRLVLNVTGGTAYAADVGQTPPREWAVNPRNYKYSWNAKPDSGIDDTVLWMGYDEIRFGSFTNEGTTFSDVHPHGYAGPLPN